MLTLVMMANPHFEIIDISDSAAFDAVRYEGDGFINKAGILPYYKEGDEIYYLFASPKPVRNPDDVVPFAMARGTRRMKEGGEWIDIRDDGAIIEAESGEYELEPLWQTACVEGEEELGLESKDIKQMYDLGSLKYKEYAIRTFPAEVNKDVPLIEAVDSRDVRWMRISDVKEAIEIGEFNPLYLDLVSAIDSAVTQHSENIQL